MIFILTHEGFGIIQNSASNYPLRIIEQVRWRSTACHASQGSTPRKLWIFHTATQSNNHAFKAHLAHALKARLLLRTQHNATVATPPSPSPPSLARIASATALVNSRSVISFFERYLKFRHPWTSVIPITVCTHALASLPSVKRQVFCNNRTSSENSGIPEKLTIFIRN